MATGADASLRLDALLDLKLDKLQELERRSSLRLARLRAAEGGARTQRDAHARTLRAVEAFGRAQNWHAATDADGGAILRAVYNAMYADDDRLLRPSSSTTVDEKL